jgi:hypothetical protein
MILTQKQHTTRALPHPGRFEREAQVLASLNDPHIATIYGLEQGPGSRGIVMELIEGPRRVARRVFVRCHRPLPTSSLRRCILYRAVAAIAVATTVSAQARRPPTALTADTAARFAKLALACVRQEYPNKITHVLNVGCWVLVSRPGA